MYNGFSYKYHVVSCICVNFRVQTSIFAVSKTQQHQVRRPLLQISNLGIRCKALFTLNSSPLLRAFVWNGRVWHFRLHWCFNIVFFRRLFCVLSQINTYLSFGFVSCLWGSRSHSFPLLRYDDYMCLCCLSYGWAALNVFCFLGKNLPLTHFGFRGATFYIFSRVANGVLIHFNTKQTPCRQKIFTMC